VGEARVDEEAGRVDVTKLVGRMTEDDATPLQVPNAD